MKNITNPTNKKSKFRFGLVGAGEALEKALASSHPPIHVQLGGEMTVQSEMDHAEKDTA